MKRAQAEVKTELEILMIQLENGGESLTNRMGQVEETLAGLKENHTKNMKLKIHQEIFQKCGTP